MHIKEGEGGRRESTEGGTFFSKKVHAGSYGPEEWLLDLASGDCSGWTVFVMQCVRDEHGMGWSGRKRVSVTLEKFCHGG